MVVTRTFGTGLGQVVSLWGQVPYGPRGYVLGGTYTNLPAYYHRHYHHHHRYRRQGIVGSLYPVSTDTEKSSSVWKRCSKVGLC